MAPLVPLNPWLQRALIALAAGTATSGALVATAERPGKKKTKKPKKGAKGEEEREIKRVETPGERAREEAKLLEQRSMTMAELGDNLKGLGAKITGVFTREKVPAASTQQADGARAPDEIDGKRVGKKKKRRGRRKRRPQASLWDSAKESMRQTVKETVRDEVKDTPLGKVQEGASSALSSLKKAGESLKVQAAAAVERVKASIPEDAGERITKRADELGKSVSASVERAVNELPRDPNAPREPDAIDGSDRQAGAVEPKPDVKPIDVEQIASKVNTGVDAVGTWLKGPGAPGYNKSGRVRSATKDDDVVEAKDAPTTPPKREDA